MAGATTTCWDLVQGAAGGEVAMREEFTRRYVAVVREALALQEGRAREEAQKRRVELLRLRFQQDLPTREIARLWGVEPVVVQRQYDQARLDFQRALRDTLAAYGGGTGEEIDREIETLLQIMG